MLIVYSVSFSDSAGCFLEDVIFAAKAQEVEITKFAVCLNTLIQRTDQRYRTRQRNSDKSNPIPHPEPDHDDTNCSTTRASSAAPYWRDRLRLEELRPPRLGTPSTGLDYSASDVYSLRRLRKFVAAFNTKILSDPTSTLPLVAGALQALEIGQVAGTDRFLGVLRHQGFQLRLGPLTLQKDLPGAPKPRIGAVRMPEPLR